MGLNLSLSAKDHFQELLGEGIQTLGVRAHPAVQSYLVDLLSFYLDIRNFKVEELSEAGERMPATLAEMLLKANQEQHLEKRELLKQVGDRALYISGFFGDSLNRKAVDIDYYAQMGGLAYAELATVTAEDRTAYVFRTMSDHFLSYAELLTFVSEKSLIQSDESILRLYEKYLRTGSPSAHARLVEQGVLPLPGHLRKKAQQD